VSCPSSLASDLHIDPDFLRIYLEKNFTDPVTMRSSTAGVGKDINWSNVAAVEFLGAPGLNTAQQPQIQAVFANTATIIYSYKDLFFQNYIKIRCDDPRKRCQNRPDQQDPCQPKYVLPPYLSFYPE